VAFFAIEHDAARPFTVHSRAGTIRVLGTRFEARSHGDTVEVLVVEGRVALTADDGSQVELAAGEAGRIVRGVAPEFNAAPPDGPGAWLGRVLLFRDTPLADAVAEIGAAYGVPVTILTSGLDTLRVSAQFDERPLDEVLETLCRVIAARCTVTREAATIR
jgi:transmembrane sensor